MNELALFAGAGGGILGGQLLGWRTVCAVERDAYAAAILAQRQNDGLLDLFPIWSDITTFDGNPWCGIIDVISGGFPCQDISVAGKGAGIDGERSGLWGEMARIIGEVRPRFVFVENSPALTLRGLGRVLGDLAALGYDAEWGVLAAADVGAAHKRERIWIVGHTERQHASGDNTREGLRARVDMERNRLVYKGRNKEEQQLNASSENVADTKSLHDGKHNSGKSKRQIQQSRVCTRTGDIPDSNIKYVYDSGFRASEISQQQASGVQKLLPNSDCKRFKKQHSPSVADKSRQLAGSSSPGRRETGWPTEPDVGRVANGVDFRVDRLKAIGNGQVPQCMAEAWKRLMGLI